MIKFRKRDLKALRDAMKAVKKKGDLYRALHYVGDDDTKMIIEDCLKQLLPKASYRKVVAIFRLVTDLDSPWNTPPPDPRSDEE